MLDWIGPGFFKLLLFNSFLFVFYSQYLISNAFYLTFHSTIAVSIKGFNTALFSMLDYIPLAPSVFYSLF